MLDLYEVLDISEVGVSLQCPSPMKVDQEVELCLDLAEASGQIATPARVVWSDSTGRVGLALPPLNNSASHRLREWLFLNAMAGAANAASSPAHPFASLEQTVLRPNYTDTLTAVTAVQREAESLGTDLEAVLSLVASRSQSLLRASGAAIALAGKDAGVMICRASAGQSAPPVDAALQVGSGFSGECVRTGKLSRCDDAETDERVDQQSCRALGIRSMLAAPIRLGERVIGLLEVFSAQPNAFGESDSAILQRFAETILAAISRAAKAQDLSPPPAPPKPFVPAPGSVLFAHDPEESAEKKNLSGNEDKLAGIRLPRAYLYLLICAAAFIALALGYTLAPSIQPWIKEKLQARDRSSEHTVLASSQSPQPITEVPAGPAIETATLEQLQQLAGKGDPAAENALGFRYASGDGVTQDDTEAARWFTKAAENGNVKAQVALGTRYWAGRGVPPSLTQAYFWTVLARAAGDKNSKTFAEFLASHMTRAQAAAIEQQANIWYQQHESLSKPDPGR
jgi:putative methionine-R-sulfoxide reductase with GAF domain